MLRLAGTGATHPGLVRDHNEDSGFVGSDLVLVTDGVGGSAAGEVASATAAYALCATAMARRDDDPTLVLTAGVHLAQQLLAQGVEQDPDRAGMATTLTAVLTNGERCALAHLGDSRGYVLRDGEFIRVTRDHTLVAGLVDDGRISEEEARSHPWRNVVLRTVNADVLQPADVLPLAVRPGDRLLIASDGLTDLVCEDRIGELLSGHDDDAAVEVLVAEALRAGGSDNITCVVVTVIDGPRVDSRGELLGALFDPGNLVEAAARVEHTA
ncbi:MAG: PP2C family protein-serine/threonine phosphatase [Marmoricola sp.]